MTPLLCSHGFSLALSLLRDVCTDPADEREAVLARRVWQNPTTTNFIMQAQHIVQPAHTACSVTELATPVPPHF
jgi:hypothetical protein